MSHVSSQISKLESLGYIKTFLDFKGRHVAKRSISIVRQVDIDIDLTPSADGIPLRKNARPLRKNASPLRKNAQGNNTTNNTTNNSTLAPLNFDHVNDYAIQEGLTSVNTFRFFNTYKKTNWLSVNGNPINWRERLREWDIDDSKNRQQSVRPTGSGSDKSSDPFTIYDHEPF